MRPHHRTTAIVLTLVAVVFAIFFRTLESGFLRWDDDINVFENSRVQGLTAENLRWMFTDFEQAIRYKPLSWLAWALVHEVFGLNPFGFHLANVVLHCANTVLLFFLLRRLLKCGMRNAECEMESPAWLEVCAALGTLLWAVHPLRVEPVAWVTGLPYHLALFFALLATLFYLGAHAPDAPGSPQAELLARRRRLRAGRVVVSHRARFRRRAIGFGLLPIASLRRSAGLRPGADLVHPPNRRGSDRRSAGRAASCAPR